MYTRYYLAAALGSACLLFNSLTLAEEAGFELSLAAISTNMEGAFSGTGSGDLTRVNDHATGYAISGTWRFSSGWAIDLEYADHGDFDGFNVCPPELFCIAAESPEYFAAKTITLSLLGEIPLNSNWSVFGRLGYADTDLDRRFAGDADDQGVAAGAGLRWAYSDQSSLDLEYRTEAADMERIDLSVRYRFN